MAKAFAKQFYSGKAWQSCRNEYAKRKNFLCEDCLRRGIYRPGEIVHHKIEVTPMNIDNPEIVLNFQNLELVCRLCHAKIHGQHGGRWAEVNRRRKAQREKEKRYTIGTNGEVIGR